MARRLKNSPAALVGEIGTIGGVLSCTEKNKGVWQHTPLFENLLAERRFCKVGCGQGEAKQITAVFGEKEEAGKAAGKREQKAK